LLLLLTILTYGLLTFRQGFYLDDWYIILFKEKLGNEGFLLYFSKDRPFLSYPYVALMAIFGESAASWAIFALIMRWITTCTFWQLLNKLFPERRSFGCGRRCSSRSIRVLDSTGSRLCTLSRTSS